MPPVILPFSQFEALWLAGEITIELITARGASSFSFIGARVKEGRTNTEERFFKVTGL